MTAFFWDTKHEKGIPKQADSEITEAGNHVEFTEFKEIINI